LILTLILIPVYISAESSPHVQLKFYIFSDSSCSSCQEYIQLLEGEFSEALIIFIDLYPYNETITQRFEKINDLIEGQFYTPLVGVFFNDSLEVVGIGPILPETWETIISIEYEGLPIFLPNNGGHIEPVTIITDQDTITLISQLFTEDDPGNGFSPKSLLNLLPIIISAAAVDAINPCELNVLVILLSFVLFKMGEKAVLKTGLAFSSAIFIIYLVMGLGLLRGLTYIPQIKYIIFLITFTLGTLHILAFLGKNVRQIPKIFEIWIVSRLKQAVNPKTAFVAGIITAFLLLPCTSGPYILILNLLSENMSFLDGLILLLIYHAIITSPFIIITVCIHTLTITTTRLKRWSLAYQKWITLISGVTMLLLSLFLLLF